MVVSDGCFAAAGRGRFEAGGGDVLCVRYQPVTGAIALVCADGTVRIHNGRPPFEHSATIGVPVSCTSSQANVRKQARLTRAAVGVVYAGGGRGYRTKTLEASHGHATRIHFCSRSEILVSYDSGCVRRWHVSTRKVGY